MAGGERPLLAREPIPSGHKVALRTLEEGQVVHKYGQAIGVTSRRILAGAHVHDHNLISPSRRRALPSPVGNRTTSDGSDTARRHRPRGKKQAPRERTDRKFLLEPSPVLTFAGFRRPDGRVGTRNYVAVLSTVNCSATVVRRIAAAFSTPGALDEHPGVDGVIAITHGSGCGLSRDGEGFDLLRRTLTGYARHPNVGGVVVVGLGCEVNQVSAWSTSSTSRPAFPHHDHPASGRHGPTIRAGVEACRSCCRSRPPKPPRALPGLTCGGSDPSASAPVLEAA